MVLAQQESVMFHIFLTPLPNKTKLSFSLLRHFQDFLSGVNLKFVLKPVGYLFSLVQMLTARPVPDQPGRLLVCPGLTAPTTRGGRIASPRNKSRVGVALSSVIVLVLPVCRHRRRRH